MEKKLELRHLAAYLPYGLKGKYNLNDVDESYPNRVNDKELTADCVKFFLLYCKPLVIPLPELNNYMDEYNNIFYPNVQLGKIPKHAIDLRIQILSDYKTRSHEETDWLCYNHFDVFNLIDSGLALNKLTTLITQRR